MIIFWYELSLQWPYWPKIDVNNLSYLITYSLYDTPCTTGLYCVAIVLSSVNFKHTAMVIPTSMRNSNYVVRRTFLPHFEIIVIRKLQYKAAVLNLRLFSCSHDNHRLLGYKQ